MMNVLKSLVLLFVILVIPPKLFASYEITNGCEMALLEILNLNLDKAQEQLQQERLKSPVNYYVDYLENYRDMVEILVLEDKSSYNKYLEKFENRLEKMKEKESSTPYYAAIRAEMIAQTGLLNVINGDEIAGFLKIVKANKLLKKNFNNYPNFYLNKKLYGVFNVGIGNIPPAVKWATNFLGLTGDTDVGFQFLETYKKEVLGRPGLYSESLIYLIFAYQICADEQGAYEMLKRDYPASTSTTLGVYLYANALDRVGKTEESLMLLEELNAKNNVGESPFYPILLLTSKGKLNRLDKDADLYWLTYLENSKNENFKKESCIKLSYHYLIHNQKDKYEFYRNQATKYDKAVMRPDREAEVDVKRIDKINVDLLKAHFLVTGSYFDRANSILKNVDPEKQKKMADKILYYLLQGKIMSSRGECEEAFTYFDLAISQGNEILEHYAAESALMAGNLALKNKKYSAATNYYKLCQKIKCENNVYRQTIQRNAKTQLRKLKNFNQKT